MAKSIVTFSLAPVDGQIKITTSFGFMPEGEETFKACSASSDILIDSEVYDDYLQNLGPLLKDKAQKLFDDYGTGCLISNLVYQPFVKV